MTQKQGIKKKRVAKKRRVWSDGVTSGSRVKARFRIPVWATTLGGVLALTAAVILAVLYSTAKLPELAAAIGMTNPSTEAADPPATAAPDHRLATSGTAPVQAATSLAQENLQVTRLGAGVRLINEGDTPIHLTRMVLNRRDHVAGCDTNAAVNTDASGLPNYPNKLDQVLQIGDSYNYAAPACGAVTVIETYSDQGNAVFKLAP